VAIGDAVIGVAAATAGGVVAAGLVAAIPPYGVTEDEGYAVGVAATAAGGATVAAAVVAGEVCGIEIDAGVVPRAAAIEFADGGVAPTIEFVAAGGADAAANDCGTDCVEGRAGAVDFATSDAFSGEVSCFQNAHRGADWQPTSAKIATTTNPIWFIRELISWLPSRLANVSPCRHRRCGKGMIRNRTEKSVTSKSSAKTVGPVHRFDCVAFNAPSFSSLGVPALAARSRTGARQDYSGAVRSVNVSRRTKKDAIN
jgi:hypothetical protein